MVRVALLLAWLLGHLATGPLADLGAAELPSLFRGVVVADHAIGVRVISVSAGSQAALADLRPEDLIVRVQDVEVHSIEEFAAVSKALKGRHVQATVLVFRNGTPREIPLHLYSYPILQSWGIDVVPDHNFRFAEARVGAEYWARMGRGFQEAGKPARALEAYLNGLHNAPGDSTIAMHAAELFIVVGRARLEEGQVLDGFQALRQGLTMLQRLFREDLTTAELKRIRDHLEATVQALRSVAPPHA